jgi:hypothetical protein
MSFLKIKVWPVVAGFIVAAIIMTIFEYINSFFFPLPKGLDWNDAAAVKAVTASLPWTAYILVFLGWIIGAFEGGCTSAWLAGEKQLLATTILAILLVIAGIFDMMMLGFPPAFTVLGLCILAISPYLGRFAMNTFEKKKRASMAAARGN